MRFRPCIDIHNGKVKQIVGSSLRDAGDSASENFVSARGADYYARMYGNDITNSLIPEEPPYVPPYDELTEENLEQLLDLFDYSTPLYGGLLGTGDEMPKYPFIFGGIGTLAVLLLIIFGLRRRKGDAKG